MSGILGIIPVEGNRVTEEYGDNLRPYNWLDSVFELYPNGKAQLTSMLSLTKKFTPTDPEFKWNAIDLEPYHSGITGVYEGTIDDLSAIGDKTPAAGDTIFVSMPADDGKRFVVGDVLCLTRGTDPGYNVIGRIDAVGTATISEVASAVFQLYLVTSASSAKKVRYCDTAMIAGSAFPEADTFGSVTTRDAVEFSNYAQIFKRDLAMAATTAKTKFRGEDMWTRYKKDKLREISVDVETMAFLGEKYKLYDATQKKVIRFSRGLYHALKDPVKGCPENIIDFRTSYANETTWASKGKEFLDEIIRRAFMYSEDGVKLAYCSTYVLQAISNLALTYSDLNMTVDSSKFGLAIRTWECPNGTLELKTHPLFSTIPALQNTMAILDTSYLELGIFRPITYTEAPPKSDSNMLDGYRGEYSGEIGLRILNPRAFVWATGIGQAATGVV